MSARETLEKMLQNMPEDRLREVVVFATFLNWQEERDGWRQFGQSQLAHAYGSNEPEYSLTDLKQEIKS